jgi:glutaredoxin
MGQGVSVYGADGCHETRRTREHLQDLGVRHRYINVDEDSVGDMRVRGWNEGRRRTPTVIVRGDSGTELLCVPSDSELEQALSRQGFVRRTRTG